MGRTYQVREFAELAGVTVRALHHYDRLDLLKPSRTREGYRLYQDRDLERLEQIVALKFLGLDLKQIKTLRNREAPDLADTLRRQRTVLEEKRRVLDSAIAAIRDAEFAAQPGKHFDSALLKKIITAIEKQSDADWMMQYCQDHAAKVKMKAPPAVMVAAGTGSHRETVGGPDPRRVSCARRRPGGRGGAGARGPLDKLVDAFTGGDPQIAASVKAAQMTAKEVWRRGGDSNSRNP